MSRAARAGALWGLIAALTFLVLALGYRIAADATVGLEVLLAVALGCGVVVAVVGYAVEDSVGP